jgi:hypothetical protein
VNGGRHLEVRQAKACTPALLAAAFFLLASALASAADEPTDPISKLGQRSALQRWKDARSEWLGPMSRRERRQQIRSGTALDNTFAPDAAAPATVPVEPAPSETQEPPARVELTPEIAEPGPEPPMYIAPPRAAMPLQETPQSPMSPVTLTPPEPEASAPSEAPPSEPRPFPMIPEAVVTESAPTEQFSPEDPQPAVTVAELPAPEASRETAFLPQIPRTPVAPSPTPAAPPTRVAPPPAPRLPDEGPRFEIPRSEPSRTDPLIPPAPDEVPRLAGPAELPRLKKITEIAPFQSCGTDGSGVRMCPPNVAGEAADRCPDQHPLPIFEGERNFIDIEYCWEAPNLFHTPLYFEDVNLERYGHTYCEPFQTLASASKFGLQLAGLPYQMALAPVHKREYPLGYYRPGEPAPYKAYQIPLNAEAAIKAGYVYAGLSVLTP